MARRILTDEEKKLLAGAMHDVRPLDAREKLEHVPDNFRPAIKPRKPVLPAITPPTGGGIDKATAAKLTRGEYRIDGRIDLHGMTLEKAHRCLEEFLEQGYVADKRCLLIITGKGGKDGKKGKLQQEVPRWLQLSGLSRMILMVSSAKPKHGGEGALYLLLRRKR